MLDKLEQKILFKKFDDFFFHNKDIHIQASDKIYLEDYFRNKFGWLYIMRNEDHIFLKMGRTSKTPMIRSKSLSNTGVASDYEVLYSCQTFNQFLAETELFKQLKKFRSHGEFFVCNLEHAITVMNKVIQNQEKSLQLKIDLDMLKLDLSLAQNALLKKSTITN